MERARYLLIGALLCTGLIACGDDSTSDNDDTASSDTGSDAMEGDVGVDAPEDTGETDAGVDSGTDTTADAEPDVELDENGFPICNTDGASNARIVEGDYHVALSVTPLGGLLINLRANIVASDDEILSFELWSRSPENDWESDAPIARVCNLPLSDSGVFIAEIDIFTVPAQGTTTGVQVDVTDARMEGELLDAMSFCGEAWGYVGLLDFDLGGSPFRGVPDGMQTNPPETGCEAMMAVTYDPIAECPDLINGVNDITSAELDREFILNAPDSTTGDPMPLVFIFHGLGGTAEGMRGYSGFDDVADEFIRVYPQGARDGGEQVFPVDWNILAAQYDNDNQDLVFFDDMLSCVSEQYNVDDQRIYITGMSAGGLMTTFLTVHRSDVIAASAPASGGYLQSWPSMLDREMPVLVTWGGESDTAVGTNFNDTNLALIEDLGAGDFVYATCNHNQGHTWPEGTTDSIWAWLSAFTLDSMDNPFADGLTDAFPDYCTLPQ